MDQLDHDIKECCHTVYGSNRGCSGCFMIDHEAGDYITFYEVHDPVFEELLTKRPYLSTRPRFASVTWDGDDATIFTNDPVDWNDIRNAILWIRDEQGEDSIGQLEMCLASGYLVIDLMYTFNKMYMLDLIKSGNTYVLMSKLTEILNDVPALYEVFFEANNSCEIDLLKILKEVEPRETREKCSVHAYNIYMTHEEYAKAVDATGDFDSLSRHRAIAMSLMCGENGFTRKIESGSFGEIFEVFAEEYKKLKG